MAAVVNEDSQHTRARGDSMTPPSRSVARVVHGTRLTVGTKTKLTVVPTFDKAASHEILATARVAQSLNDPEYRTMHQHHEFCVWYADDRRTMATSSFSKNSFMSSS